MERYPVPAETSAGIFRPDPALREAVQGGEHSPEVREGYVCSLPEFPDVAGN